MDKEFFKKIQADGMKYSKFAKDMEKFFHGKNVMKIQEKIEKQKQVSKSKKMAESFGLNYEKFKKM